MGLQQSWAVQPFAVGAASAGPPLVVSAEERKAEGLVLMNFPLQAVSRLDSYGCERK